MPDPDRPAPPRASLVSVFTDAAGRVLVDVICVDRAGDELPAFTYRLHPRVTMACVLTALLDGTAERVVR